ncbi:MAG: hypothetical protein E7635_01160 [Ruminococcaceae bacterium]|nr:hypothetical protein [Oscillospiraceae bacterium]
MKIFGKEIKLFNYYADGKGVKKEPEGPKGLKNFFISYFRKFTQLVTVNIYMILGNFPVLFALLALSGNLNIHLRAPATKLYTVLYGILGDAHSPVLSAINGVFGLRGDMSVPTLATNIFWGLSLLIFVTFGLVNVGTTYILRNMVKGEPIFMWGDFWYAIKRNFKQGILFGILDLVFISVLAGDIIFYYYTTSTGNFMMNMFFWFSLFLAVLYYFMRFYIYIVMVTFDLSIVKILKNALIFSFLGFKRNIMALLGTVAMLFLTAMVFGFFIPLGVIIPFVFLFSTCAYMSAYAAFPKVKEYMIDPYYEEEPEDEGEEPIFKDRG